MLVLIALGGWAAYSLRPERLVRIARAALREKLGDAVRIESVTFRPFTTIRVAGIRAGAAAGTTLSVDHADVTCTVGALLSGRIEPTRITLHAVRVEVVLGGATTAPTGDALEAHLAPLAAQLQSYEAQLVRLPDLELVDGEVIFRRAPTAGDQVLIVHRAALAASGRHTSAGYELSLRRADGADVLTARWDRALDAFDLRSGWLDLGTIAHILPQSLRDRLRAAHVDGRVHAVRLVVAASGEGGRGVLGRVRGAELEFDRLSAVVTTGDAPAESGAAVVDDAADLYRLRQGSMRVNYTPGGAGASLLALDGEATLSGAPLRLQATADVDLLRAAWEGRSSLLDALIEAELGVTRFELPTPATHPRLLAGERLPGPVRAAFEDYEPRGAANITIRLAPRLVDEPISTRLAAAIEPLGGSCRYFHFPYPFDDVRGRILVLDGRIVLEELTGRHGGAQVRARGALNNSSSWTGFELAFDATDVPLDDALLAALPPEYHKIWAHADPRGVARVETRVRRPEGSEAAGPRPLQIDVKAELEDASVSLGDAGRLVRASGAIAIRDKAVQLSSLTGWLNDAQTTINGVVTVERDEPAWDLQIAARDVAIEESSTVLDDDDLNTPPETIRIAARADVVGRVRGAEGGPGERHLVATLRRGTLTAFGPEATWTGVSGQATVHDGLVKVDVLRARQGDAAVEVSATMPPPGDANTPAAVDLRLKGPRIESLLPQFAPGPWRTVGDEIGLRGAGEVHVELQRPPAVEPTARIEVLDAEMRSPRLPLDLRDVRADVRIGPKRFEVTSASARCGETGELSGRGTCSWDATTIDLNGELRALQLAMTPELVAALPIEVRQTLERIHASGGFSLELDTLAVNGAAPFTWRFAGRMPFRMAALQIGVPIENAFGELRGSGSFTPGLDAQLDTRFELDRAQAAGVELVAWRGRMTRAGLNAPVRLEELSGRVAGGEALGAASIDPARGAYQLSLNFRDVPLDALLPPGDAEQSRTASGRLDGQLTLEGVGEDVASRRGGGQARIRGASFLQAPLLVSVFRASWLSATRGEDDIDAAEITFRWDGAAVRLVRVDIVSRDLRLVGEGVWFPADNRVEMTLVGAHPRDWPRLAMVTDLIESAAGEIVQFRVTGTLTKPTVSTQPLRRLDETLRRLLSAER